MYKIFLFFILISFPLFSEYQYDANLVLTHIRINDFEFIDNTGTNQAVKFENDPIGVKYFDEDAKISIDYEYINQPADVSNLEFAIFYNGNELDKSIVNNSSLSFKLSNVFEQMPVSNDDSFKIEFKMSYDTVTLTDRQTKTVEITFYYDTVAPEKINSLKAVAGNQNIKLTWEYPEGVDEKEIDRVLIYYKDNTEEEEYKEVEAGALSTEYRIKDLINEHEYSIYLKVFDSAGNESEKSDEVKAVPVPVDDFYKYYRKSGGKEDGGYCFIATAAYGSYDNGMVKILRSFRDEFLPESLVSVYYKYSPPLANIIAKSKILSLLVRLLLEPVVLYVSFMMYADIWFKLLLLSFFVLLFFLRNKFKGIYV